MHVGRILLRSLAVLAGLGLLMLAEAAHSDRAWTGAPVMRPAYAQPAPCSSVTINANLASPQRLGTAITFTAGCGSSGYEFRWYIRQRGDAWQQMTGYTTNPFRWETGSPQSGALVAATYEVAAHARRIGTNADLEAWNRVEYVLTGGCSSVSISPNQPSPGQLGTTITFTGSCTGTTSGFEFRWYVRAEGGSWQQKTGYTTSPFQWQTATSGSFNVGTYEVAAHGRAVGSTRDLESWTAIGYRLETSCSTLTITANPPSPRPKGTLVDFSAACSGGGTYEFRWYTRYIDCADTEEGNWRLRRSYGTSPWQWVSGTYENGQSPPYGGCYHIAVHARRVGSTIDYERWTFIRYDEV